MITSKYKWTIKHTKELIQIVKENPEITQQGIADIMECSKVLICKKLHSLRIKKVWMRY